MSLEGSTPSPSAVRNEIFDNAAGTYGPVGNRQTTLVENEGCWGFKSPLGHCKERPGGPARSGRHSLTVKNMGSNPIQGNSKG